MKSTYHVEAIERGLDILALFRADRPTLTLIEITRLVSGVPSTTLRIVNTLEDMGFLESMPDKSAYRAGPSSLRIGHAFIGGSRLRAIAAEPLARLRDASGESVSLISLAGESIYFVDHLRSGDAMSVTFPIGARLAALDTAAGKAILAWSPKPNQDASLATFAKARAPGKRSFRDGLAAELVEARQLGFAVQDQAISGMRSIAAPVVGTDGTAVAAITIGVGAGRYELDDLKRLVSPLVVGAAAEIGARWRATAALPSTSTQDEAVDEKSEEAPATRDADAKSRYHVEALSRGLSTLLAFTAANPLLTLTEIAQRTESLVPTTFRVVSTLRSLGYLSLDEPSGKYELALKVLELGYDGLAWLSLSDFVMPRLRRFEAEAEVSVYLSVLAGNSAVDIVSLVRPGVMSTVGRSYPLYCTPGGKVLLAFMAPEQARGLIEAVDLIKRAPKTVIDPAALLAELALIRQRGYSVSDEEFLPGSSGVGVPLLNSSGECVASIACGMHGRDSTDVKALDRLVVRACELAADLTTRLAARFS